MHQRLLIAAFILGATLLCLRVPTASASALGLADGTYNITLDFTDNSFDATGTITISSALVTAFHININGTALDCTGCGVNTDTPDNVAFNEDQAFWIEDNNLLAQFRRLQLEVVGGNNRTTFLFCDGACESVSEVDGGWTARAIPEPASLSLLGLGALALFLRRRRSEVNRTDRP